MLHEEISATVLKSLKIAGITPKDTTDADNYGTSIKSLISDHSVFEKFDPDEKKIKIKLKSSLYKSSLIFEVKNEFNRVSKQKSTIDNLLKNKETNTAWCIVSTYYYCFFAANELSKLNGSHQINLSDTDIDVILSDFHHLRSIYKGNDSNINFRCSIKHGEDIDTCSIELEKYSPKPHKNVWDNFQKIISKTKSDENLKEKIIFTSVLTRNNQWPNPSDVRNKWNYSDPKYFSAYGDTTGETFKELLKNKKNALEWSQKNHLYPDEINQASFIAYMFHTLSLSYNHIVNRFNFS